MGMFNLNQLKQLYTDSPLWTKKLYASIPFDIRNGREYRDWKKFLDNEIDVKEYELLKIKESVLFAYKNTKYYSDLFKKLDINPHDIKSIQDFQKIPFVDKDIIRENYNDFLVANIPENKKLTVTTGGTSGSPTGYIQSSNVWAKELAYYMHFFGKYNYSPMDLKASFRGGDFSNVPNDEYWFMNPVNNEFVFSPTNINSDTIEKYVNFLNKIKPKFFYGYPSSILFLLCNMQERNLNFNFCVDAVFLISEAFSKEDVNKIKDFFKCPVASTYGHSERLVLAESTGDSIVDYKVNRRYGYFELINENNSIIESNDKKGEIVGTEFDNYAMPILRYKTGDFTSYEIFDEDIISFVDSPRKQIYQIEDYDNNKIATQSLIRPYEMLEYGIIRYQIVQTAPGKIKLHLLAEKTFNLTKQKELLNSIHSKAENRLQVEIIMTEKFIFSERGKFIPFIKEY